METELQGGWNYVRVRVNLYVRNVLTRFATISRGGQREFYKIQYEKVPKFCSVCGFFGHMHTECGTREHEVSKIEVG